MAFTPLRLALGRNLPTSRSSFNGSAPRHVFRPAARPLRLHRAAAPVPAASADSASVTFRIPYRTDFGQVVKVVGGPESLGAWNAKDAPVLDWSEGDEWTGTITLPAGQHEFKVIVSSPEGEAAIWEDGPNRSLDISGDALSLLCRWGHAADDAVSAPAEIVAAAVAAVAGAAAELSVDAEAAAAATGDIVGKMTVVGEADVAEAAVVATEVAKMSVEGATAVGEVGKMTVDSAVGDASQAATAAEAGTAVVGKMTVDVAAPVEEAEEQGSNPLADAFSSFLKALGLSSTDEDDDQGGSGGGDPGSGGPSAVSALPAAASRVVAIGAASLLLASQSVNGARAFPLRSQFFRGPRCAR